MIEVPPRFAGARARLAGAWPRLAGAWPRLAGAWPRLAGAWPRLADAWAAKLRRMRHGAPLLGLALLAPGAVELVVASNAAWAQGETSERAEPSLEGLYYDWSLYGFEENGNPVCYLSSGLVRSSDQVPRRRQAVVLITNRPAEGKKGVVSVIPGYTYEDGGAVLMSIGRRQFHMFTAGDTAWAEDGDDLQITAAIRTGATLVVTGRMKSGIATTDTFSLKGFGPALAALDRACPVAGPAAAPKHVAPKKRKSER